MSASVNLGLINLESNQFNPEVTYNSNLEVLDILSVFIAIDTNLNTPPTGVNGECYIVGPSPTGDWSTHSNEVAYYYNGWKYIIPKIGWTVTNSQTLEVVVFNGTAWVTIKTYNKVDIKTISYTLTKSDSGSVIVINSASNLNITLPQTSTEDINVGFYCDIIRQGTGTLGILTQGSDIILSKNSYTNVAPQYGRIRISKIIEGSTNTWHLSGDLA